LENPELYLCNPDKTEIAVIKSRKETLTLRFNDLSELTFEVPELIFEKGSKNDKERYYDRLESKRLVLVADIGWFQITSVSENEGGNGSYKTIKAESLQTTFKNKGFYAENRLYKFYNPVDPKDESYDSDDIEAIPSVIGQLYQQLGVQIDLSAQTGGVENSPPVNYDSWTLTYIEPDLIFAEGAGAEGRTNLCRSLNKEGAAVTYGYDFMVNDVENAFEVIFIFDFLRQGIEVRFVENITQKTNIYLSLENVVKTLTTEEDASEITTVLNCNGSNLDIRAVNPIGTNYITDFSYYMDEIDKNWMSDGLIAKLKEWQADIDAKQEEYSGLVLRLRDLYQEINVLSETGIFVSNKLEDLGVVRDKYIENYPENAKNNTNPTGLAFLGEEIGLGEHSIEEKSIFFDKSGQENQNFEGTTVLTCYKTPPEVDENGEFSFANGDESCEDSAENNYAAEFIYCFDAAADVVKHESYCVLVGAAKLKEGQTTETKYVSGLQRMVAYNHVSTWIAYYEKQNAKIKNNANEKQEETVNILADMQEISSKLNIVGYFINSPKLYKELECYWIEGDYENETLAALDTTTEAERLDLSKQLMEAGKQDLKKVSRPKFAFTVDAINFLCLHEFKEFSNELELGKIVTIEKSPDVYYYPILTEMSFEFGSEDSFKLTFSNALKLTDWGYSFADIITNASKTSRMVSANWQELMNYTRSKGEIEDLLLHPLDRTLRFMKENMVNQEFIVDDTGILGRKIESDILGTFYREQVRIINNVMMFTDDAWETAKTALGKVHFTDENGVDTTAYGLVAEVLVGSLIMGETLFLTNDSNTMTFDKNGIIIRDKNIMDDQSTAEVDESVVFRASNDGNVFLKGRIEATSGKIGACIIEEDGTIRSEDNSFLIGINKSMVGGLTIEKTKTMTVGGYEIVTSSLYSDNFKLETASNAINKYATSMYFFDPEAEISEAEGVIATTFITEKGVTTEEVAASRVLLSDYISVREVKTIDEGVVISGTEVHSVVGGTSIEMSPGALSESLYIANLVNSGTGIIGTSWKLQIYIYERVGDTSNGNRANLLQDKEFRCYYRSNYDVTYAHRITVKKGESFAEKEMEVHFLGIESFWIEAVGRTWYGFTQSLATSKNISFVGSLIPVSPTYNVGDVAVNNRWNNVCATNLYGTVTSYSDRNLKNSIVPLSEKYSEIFDNLKPSTFKYNDGTSGRTHVGLIANELKDAIENAGLTTLDCAAYCAWGDGTGNETCGIRYEELVPLTIYEIQKAKRRIESLEKEIEELKGDS
jgi:hypothetical protein